jgi:hypothetical protein
MNFLTTASLLTIPPGKSGGVTQTLFQAAFTARSLALQQGRESPILGLLFKKARGASCNETHHWN